MKLWSYEGLAKPGDDIVDVDEGIDIIALDTEGKIWCNPGEVLGHFEEIAVQGDFNFFGFVRRAIHRLQTLDRYV